MYSISFSFLHFDFLFYFILIIQTIFKVHTLMLCFPFFWCVAQWRLVSALIVAGFECDLKAQSKLFQYDCLQESEVLWIVVWLWVLCLGFVLTAWKKEIMCVKGFKKCVKANVENCKHWETLMLNCVGCINIDMSTLHSHFESSGTLWSYLLIFSGRSI